MAIEKVREYLKKYGKDNEILEFEVSSATVALAAEALHCEPGRIAKSLTFMVKDKPVMVVTAGDYKIDNSKYKHFFGAKASMLSFNDVETIIGHAVGGVCPFAINDGVDVYLDISMKQYDYVYPACGSSNSAIKLNMEELEKLSNSKAWIDVCKLIETV